MYMYVYVHVHVLVKTSIKYYTCIYIYIGTQLLLDKKAYISLYDVMHTHIHVRICTSVGTSTCTCIIDTYMYV